MESKHQHSLDEYEFDRLQSSSATTATAAAKPVARGIAHGTSKRDGGVFADDKTALDIPQSLLADSKSSAQPPSLSGSHKASQSKADPHSFKDEKTILDEIQEELEADAEFELLKNSPAVPRPVVGQSALARRFVQGFKIQSMNMRDALSGKLMWRSAHWDIHAMFSREISEEIPKEILQCRVVSREIIFTSSEEMQNFRLEQRVFFQGVCIEEWFFKFGYVMAGSRNSWQQTIDAAPPSEMLPYHVLSGNVVFETSFFDDREFLCKNSIRIYYV